MTDNGKSPISINAERLLRRIGELAESGARDDGGVCRLALTVEDGGARDKLSGWMRGAGLDVTIDRIGNILGTRPGREYIASVATGSHLDTVATGGRLDGAYGVLAGLEVAETLADHGIDLKRPLTVCAFTNEEGVRFHPDMMGSLVIAGGLEVEAALAAIDGDGVLLSRALSEIGYAGEGEPTAFRPHAFVELHVEQGPVLDREGIAIGAVTDLQGISWTEVTLTGTANHAGTTPMNLRSDAGHAAAQITVAARKIAADIGNGQTATVGHLTLSPNLTNVIAERAVLHVDMRNPDDDLLTGAEKRLAEAVQRISEDEGVRAELRSLVRFPPVTFDPAIVKHVEDSAARWGLGARRMVSGAGHDAQMMARVAPAGMIFVPSRKGISHNPKEYTADDDLVAGANVLLATLMALANE